MRPFGVEEELLIVDAETLAPAPIAEEALRRSKSGSGSGTGVDVMTDHELTAEFKQEQIEVVCPPQATLDDQISAIREGRSLAAAAVGAVGGRLLAIPIIPGYAASTLSPGERYDAISEELGFTTLEHLTCGFHVHVEVESTDEGVGVLDRIRLWLPTLLALSANSPFWQGVDTDYSSYRYQLLSRLPATGPTDVFGSRDDYEDHCRQLLGSGVPLDAGMLYFDARLSARYQTVEVRVADISMTAERAAVIACLVRALVETAARDRHYGVEIAPVRTNLLRMWTWQASRDGVEADLVDPTTLSPAPARAVVGRLLDKLRPVLEETGERDHVEDVVTDILTTGSGARAQRRVHDDSGDLSDVIRHALDLTLR
ncbi:carboxylate-amine ligase [Brevibacterium sanguinis]|uniref:Putative glutamate--cysteine ligase 2 n=2 Tax=Brevibacterium TaxID=1696 RepID=A0A366IIX6_9MICO|nr:MULTISPECIES: glutamate--cysteine ligase [Brevibacterium]RBP65436.1 carboxylate-amine ligase [Brevibacterium sanguinis]RBP72070.1 carboxylate-amine ligase [Brevibacterium celere]